MGYELVILGSGESGLGAAKLAKKLGISVFLSDYGLVSEAASQILTGLGVEFEGAQHSRNKILKAKTIVKSPGIPDSAPIVVEAKKKGIEVISEIEFGYRNLPKKAKVIAITGTNGKTTTTLLSHHLLKSAGYDVALTGNVGISLAGAVAEKDSDYYVIEVSSFQLDGTTSFRPDVAVLLNITPDHLDRYDHSFAKYVSSKFRITEKLTKEQSFIYCADDLAITEELSKRSVEACLFAVSATRHGSFGAFIDDEHLMFKVDYKKKKPHKIPLTDIKLIGKHNMINSMTAILSALLMEVPIDQIVKGLRSFTNAPHRLELAGQIDGVQYINDSKATNVDAVYYALEGINRPIVWIAGGVDKGNDYSQIAHLVQQKVKIIIGLGIDNKKLRSAFSKMVKIVSCKSMAKAIELARKHATTGDVVLLSPACASFDLFKNYEDRGDQFKAVVKSLQQTQLQS